MKKNEKKTVTLDYDEWKLIVIILRGDARPHPINDALLADEIKRQVEAE